MVVLLIPTIASLWTNEAGTDVRLAADDYNYRLSSFWTGISPSTVDGRVQIGRGRRGWITLYIAILLIHTFFA